MPATPKTKPSTSPAPAARPDRTSAVVTATLILLTALGIITVFWEPLTALAVGAPSAESVADTRGGSGDGGTAATSSPSETGAAATAAAAPDASGSS
jgi:hypothetical protein